MRSEKTVGPEGRVGVCLVVRVGLVVDGEEEVPRLDIVVDVDDDGGDGAGDARRDDGLHLPTGREG